MIPSINRDVFDAVFFCEEEFGKIDKYSPVVNSSTKNLVSDIIKFVINDPSIDLSNMIMRETDIRASKDDTPMMNVYFVKGITFTYEQMLNVVINMNSIIYFPSIYPNYGIVIILEDIFDAFFKKELYVFYNSDGSITPLKNEVEENMFIAQVRVVDSISDLFRRCFGDAFEGFEFMPLFIANHLVFSYMPSPKDIMNDIRYNLSDLLALTSIRRYLRPLNPMVTPSEFDRMFMVPFIASLTSYNFTSLIKSLRDKPKVMLAITNAILYAMNILESSAIRNLDLPRKYIYLIDSFKNVDQKVFGDAEEMEEILVNECKWSGKKYNEQVFCYEKLFFPWKKDRRENIISI